MIRTMRRRPEPQVPIDIWRHRRGLGRPVSAKKSAAHPDVNSLHRSNRPCLEQLDHAAIIFRRVNLSAHLRGLLRPPRGIHHPPAFIHRMRQRLLTIDMLTKLKRRDRRMRVHVIWRADHHRVDVLLLEHLPPVGVAAGFFQLLKLLGDLIEIVRVDVADGDDVLFEDAFEVSLPLLLDADDGDIQLLGGRVALSFLAEAPLADPYAETGGSTFQKSTTTQSRHELSWTTWHGRLAR